MVVRMERTYSIICSLLSWGDILWLVCMITGCVQEFHLIKFKNQNFVRSLVKICLISSFSVTPMSIFVKDTTNYMLNVCVVVCSVQSVPHHLLFLEYNVHDRSVPLPSTGVTSVHLLVTHLRRDMVMLPLTCLVNCL